MEQFQSDEGRSENMAEVDAAQALEVKDVGFMGRLFGMLHSPGKSFAVVNSKWDWLIASFLFVMIGFGALQIQKPYLLPDIKRAALENIEKFKDSMSAADYQKVHDDIETGMEENFEFTPKTVVIGFLMNLVFITLVGLVCWLAGNFIFGGKASFWHILSLVAFAGIISLIHDFARGGLMTMNGTSYVYLGLGLLKPDPDASFLFYFLRQCEFITIWKIAAISAALGSVYRIPAAKFAYVLVPVWLLLIALVAGANIFAGGAIIY